MPQKLRATQTEHLSTDGKWRPCKALVRACSREHREVPLTERAAFLADLEAQKIANARKPSNRLSLTEITQPDGEVCRLGVDCKRHGRYNSAYKAAGGNTALIEQHLPVDTIYSERKAELRDHDNWIEYPQKYKKRELSHDDKKRIEQWAVRNDVPYVYAQEIALMDRNGWKVVVHPELSRQGWHELALFNHLEKFKGELFREVTMLPKQPTKTQPALTLVDGIIRKNVESATSENGADLKTLDGLITLTNGLKIYVVAKHTDSAKGGGGQKNQSSDALTSLKEQRRSSDFIVAAILDGDYYRKKNKAGEDFLTRKRRDFPFPNVWIGDYREFLEAARKGLFQL